MISIVCPVYCHTDDHKAYLAEALESVSAQTYRETELVIVDDSSPIEILPIVESIDNLPPTRILRNAANLRHAESRNVGIQAANGELIAFLDHDDVWLPEKLERQIRVLNENPDVAMVFCDVEVFGRCVPNFYIDQKTVPERPSLIWLLTRSNCVITASAVLARKQAIFDIGFFNSRYSICDDYDAWVKILARAPIVHLSETLVRYRLHAHNVSYSVDRLKDNRLLTALMLNICRTLPLTDKIRLMPTLARKLAGRVYWTLFGR
ncbi:MAG: glycosyltransferase [Armatimonadetes bacterium]|nr:glycosyltransferase [Armatimonadota bacterium]